MNIKSDSTPSLSGVISVDRTCWRWLSTFFWWWRRFETWHNYIESFVCRCRLDRATVNAELDEVVRAVIENYFEPEKNGLIWRKE